jgi:hypothetical protein
LKTKISFFTILFFAVAQMTFAQVPPKASTGNSQYGMDDVKEADMPIMSAEGDNNYKKRTTVFLKEGKYGLQRNDSVILPAVYKNISYINEFASLLQKNNSYGVANGQGIIIIPVEYDSIKRNYDNSRFYLYKNGKAGTSTFSGERALPLEYDNILYSSGLSHYSYVIKNKDSLLLYDNKVVNGSFLYIGFYSNAVVAKQNGRYGILQNNKTILAFEYDSIYLPKAITNYGYNTYNKHAVSKPFIDHQAKASFFIIKQTNKYGLINAEGTILYPADNDLINYDNLRYIFTIQKDKRFGIYFEHSKQKTAVEFESVYTDGAQFITVKKNGKYGILNYSNQQVLPFEYEGVSIMGLNTGFLVTQNGKKGWLTSKGDIVIPIMYDEVDDFLFGDKFRGLYKVSLDKKYGIVDEKNNTVIPIKYDEIYGFGNSFLVKLDKKSGIYSRQGKEICKAEYDKFEKSITESSNILFSYKDSAWGIIKGNEMVLYPPVFKQKGYLTNTDGLLNPFSNNGKWYQYVKDKKNKYGIFEERTAQIVVPVVYDDIFQKFELDSITYFSARMGNKFGLINNRNAIVIPFVYDTINISKNNSYNSGRAMPQFIVKKGKKYGVVNLQHKVIIPFEYSNLVKLDDDNFYKAERQNHFIIINGSNKVISNGPFEEVSMFEDDEALTFYDGKMRVINKNGNFISTAVPMQPHTGFATFEELKQSFIEAMNSTEISLLKKFADKIAPSEHIVYFLKENMFTQKALGYLDLNYIKNKYYEDLLKFKLSEWNSKYYRKTSFTEVEDYTIMDDKGFVTNKRINDHAFGDTRFLEKVLRNAIKINGYWISSYFMSRTFNR